MSTFPAYAGLGPVQTPFFVQRLMLQIGRILGPAHILRTTDNLGAEGSFEDGAKLAGAVSHVELYKPANVQEWAVNLLVQKDPEVAKQPRAFQIRAAACVSAVLGIDGQSPTEKLIVWLDSRYQTPQHLAAVVARDYSVPVHDLADPATLKTWESWVQEHTPQCVTGP